VLTDSGWPTELGSFEADYPFPLTRESLNVNRRYYKKYLSNQGQHLLHLRLFRWLRGLGSAREAG
jgi:hypothetical protein